MFLEATYGQSKNELAGCGLAQGGTGPSFCQSAFPMNPVANRVGAGLGGLPYLFPDAVKIQEPTTTRTRCCQGVPTPIWQDGRICHAAELPVGQPHPNTPPNIPFPGFLNINRDQGHLDQSDQGRRAAHDQDGLLQHAQLQGAAARRLERHHQLRQRHQQPARLAVRLRERGARHLQLVPAGLELRRGRVRLRQHRGVHPGQLEGQREA